MISHPISSSDLSESEYESSSFREKKKEVAALKKEKEVDALRAGNAVLRERVLAKQQVSDQIIWPFASALYET